MRAILFRNLGEVEFDRNFEEIWAVVAQFTLSFLLETNFDRNFAKFGGTRGRNLLLEEIFNEIWAKLLVAIVSTSKFRMKFLEIWATFCEILKRNLGDLKRNPWLGQMAARLRGGFAAAWRWRQRRR